MNRKGTAYEIRVITPSDQSWQEWFEGMSITREGKNITVIHGRIVDQAALHGILNRIQELKLKLISVRQIPDTNLDEV
jgi:hypothetical protein